MSGLFAARSTGDPWFRAGRLEVGTTMLVVLAVVASWLAWVLMPQLPAALWFSPPAVVGGQLWRLFTWPLANPLDLWAVLNLFFFWYFGTELEQQVGKARLAGLLIGIWASLTGAAALASIVAGAQGLAGIGLVQFLVLLLWIAENPNRPFFFNIPAWVLGAVLVGVQILTMVAGRDVGSLITLLIGVPLVAISARRAGLLVAYRWLPGAGRRKPASAPRVPRQQARAERSRGADRARLDELLDQISAHGLDSLTPGQRRELSRLRDRLRGN